MGKRNLDFLPNDLLEKRHYSYSRLGTFTHCEHEFFLKYVCGKQSQDNIYGKVGNLCHDIIEDIIKGKCEPNEALTKFNDGLFDIELKGFTFPDEKIKMNYVECINHYFNQPHNWVYDKVEIERGVYTYVDDIVMIGYIDAILYRDNKIYIIDHKTSSISTFRRDDLVAHSRQLLFYAIGLALRDGIKLSDVELKFNMVKYCLIKWKGVTKERQRICERNKIIEKMKNDITKDLEKEGYDTLQIMDLMNKSLELNSFEVLPDFIKEKYTMEDYFIEVEITKESVQEVLNFIKTSVVELERMEKSKDSNWRGLNIFDRKNTWYCSFLCGMRKYCKYYKAYTKAQIDKKEELNENEKELKKLGLI